MTAEQKKTLLTLISLTTISTMKIFIAEVFGTNLQIIKQSYLANKETFLDKCLLPENKARYKSIRAMLIQSAGSETSGPNFEKLSEAEKKETFRTVFEKMFIEPNYNVDDITRLHITPYVKYGGVDAILEEYMAYLKKTNSNISEVGKTLALILLKFMNIENVIAQKYELLPLFASQENREIVSKQRYVEMMLAMFEDMKVALGLA